MLIEDELRTGSVRWRRSLNDEVVGAIGGLDEVLAGVDRHRKELIAQVL